MFTPQSLVEKFHCKNVDFIFCLLTIIRAKKYDIQDSPRVKLQIDLKSVLLLTYLQNYLLILETNFFALGFNDCKKQRDGKKHSIFGNIPQT